jgi:nucleotide-binding universal stress UspA family protein
MFTFMITGEPSAKREQTSRRVIIVGVDDSAEAEAAARWAVREAELRRTDVLLVHAYDVPILGPKGRPAAIAHAREVRQTLLDKVTTTLTVPAAMHIDQLIEIDRSGFLLPRLSEKAEMTVLGQDHPALDLGYAFIEASLREAPALVMHSAAVWSATRHGSPRCRAPLAELASGEQDTRLNLAEILAGWKTDYPDINVDSLTLTRSYLSSVFPTAGGNGRAGSVLSPAPYSNSPRVRSP